MATYVHQSVEESSCGEHNAFRFEGDTPRSDQSGNLTVFNEQFAYRILPDMKVGCIFQFLSPGPNELSPVALGAGAPHGWTFRAV